MIFKVYKSSTRKGHKCVLLVLCAAIFAVHADEVAETGASANLRTAYISDNNVKRLGTAIGDEYFVVSPTLAVLKEFGKHSATLNYDADYSRFNALSSLNYNNHNVNANLAFDHTLRFSTDFTVSYENGVDVITGANSLASDFTEFTSLESARAVAAAQYGSEDSRGQLVMRVESGSQKYSGNEQEFRSVDSVGTTSQFFYRTAPNTRILSELSLVDFNYTQDSANGDQSNLQGTLLVGMEWRLSEQLYSLVKVGYQQKQFDNPSLRDISGLSYLIDVSWSPFADTQIDFSGSRNVIESTIQNVAAFVSTSTGLQLKHSFSEALALSIAYLRAKNTFGSGRDNNQDISIGVDYQFNELSNIALEYKMQDKDSTLGRFSYKANILNLAYTLTLD